MSVINKMLRDLDRRQARGIEAQVPSTSLPTGALMRGEFALSTPKLGGGGWPRRPVFLTLACLLLVLAAVALWWVVQRPAPTNSAADTRTGVVDRDVLPSTSFQQAASAPVTLLPAAVLVAASTGVSTASTASIPAKPDPVEAVSRLAASWPSAATMPANITGQREPVALGLRMDSTLSARKLAERSVGTERASVPASEVPKGPTPNEALERAQALWNTGSRDAAIELLTDAVVVAERAGSTSSTAQSNPVLLPLVRELTRMQLAEARFSAVWDLLTRLEPQLGIAPDLWAIRGNAAQRLGRHQDSVHAYLAALQMRPNEQRWLLGAAVSLAALGQVSSAAEMAEKARTVGVVSAEVLVYLRQMGVSLRDK